MKKLIALTAALALAMSAPAFAQSSTAKPGDVWVNGKTYHCPGTRYFGKTKEGAYQDEKTAQAAGVKGSGGKTCAEREAAKKA